MQLLFVIIVAIIGATVSDRAQSEREYDAGRKAAKRASERDVPVPAVKDQKRRDELALDDCAWLRYYLPEVFYHPFTSDHKQIIAGVGQSLRYGTSKCFAAPRRDGKSTITKYLALKYSLYRQVRFPLIICATGPKADEALTAIKAKLRMSSRRLMEDFPLECVMARYVGPAPARATNVTINGGQRVFLEWRADRIILPKLESEVEESGQIGPILMAAGISSDHIQGCNVYDIRPDFLMLDDLDSRDSLAAQDGKVADKIETIIEQNLGGLGGQGRRLGQVMLCTITSRRSVAFRYSDPKIKPAYSGVRIKRLKKYPVRTDLWEEYISLRQKGRNTLNDEGQTLDPLGRIAHRFYLENRAAMDEGAELSNEHDYNREIAPDGSEQQASALQMCFDYIADKGETSFQTEHQNDPPKEDDVEQLVLTAYHVQHHCRTGLEQRLVPSEAVAIVAGLDVKKLGFHYVVWAFNEAAVGCCIDYGFHEINKDRRTDEKDFKSVELAILNGLHEWREGVELLPYVDTDGHERPIDLALIDRGWKHESWASQPVDRFCAEAGITRFLPCKGEPNYRTPKPNRMVIPGDNYHVSFADGVPFVVMNSDHWKQKVHEGFMAKPGEPGSLGLFEPPASRSQPHMSYAKHITSEVWERRFKPGFNAYQEGWFKVGSQNHWFDATYQAMVAGAIRGISAMKLSTTTPAAPPQPAVSIPIAQGRVMQPESGAYRSRW